MSRYTDINFQTKKLPPVSGYWNEDLVTLEVALKRVESLFSDLPRSIRTAKKHCTFPSPHGLTHDESAAVYLYTMDGDQKSFYKILNNALRSENRAILRVWFPFLKLFEVAIKKLPSIKGSVWRGVPEDVSSQFKRDQTFTWWSISSCSQSVNVIQDFLSANNNSTLFMIEVFKAKDVSSYSYYPNENEVLLTIGTELRVKGDILQHPGGLKIVHLVQMKNDDDDDDDEESSSDIVQPILSIPIPVADAITSNISAHASIISDTSQPSMTFPSMDLSSKFNDKSTSESEKAILQLDTIRIEETSITPTVPVAQQKSNGNPTDSLPSTTSTGTGLLASSKVDIEQLMQTLAARVKTSLNVSLPQNQSSIFRRHTKSVENFCYILENCISISSTEQQVLRGLINFGVAFDDINSTECIDFLRKIVNEKVIFILSRDSMENLSKTVRNEPLLYAIYVIESSEKKSSDSRFYRGSFSSISRLCQQLSNDLPTFTYDLTGVCSIPGDFVGISTLNYAQILKDILLESDEKRDLKKEMIEFCREEYADNPIQLKLIDEFARNYQQNNAIDWYLRHETFIYKMVTRAFRILDPDILYNLRYFLQHLHGQLKSSNVQTKPITVYRTLRIRRDLLDKMKKYQNPLVSFNEFLFLRKNRSAVEPGPLNIDSKLVRFQILVDSNAFENEIPNKPNEILLTIGTVFRLTKIEQINEETYAAYLIVNDDTLKAGQLVTNSLRDAVRGPFPLVRMAKLMKHRDSTGYVEYFARLLMDDPYAMKDEIANITLGGLLHSVGNYHYEKQQYEPALYSLKTSLKVYTRVLSEDDVRLTPTYNNIGSVYHKQGLNEEALEYHRKAYEIQRKSKNPDMDSISTYIGNIASVLIKLGRHEEAARYFELDVQIKQKIHPKNDHADLAMAFYYLAGSQYRSRQFTKAVENYQKCLEIELICHPADHPTVAMTYYNKATALEELGRLKEAKEAVENAIKRLLMTKKEEDENVQTFRKHLQLIEQKVWMKDLLVTKKT